MTSRSSATGRLFGGEAHRAGRRSAPWGTRSAGSTTPARLPPEYGPLVPDVPQYLEGADGMMFRYNADRTIDAIAPSEVPDSVGVDQYLYIYREMLTS